MAKTDEPPIRSVAISDTFRPRTSNSQMLRMWAGTSLRPKISWVRKTLMPKFATFNDRPK